MNYKWKLQWWMKWKMCWEDLRWGWKLRKIAWISLKSILLVKNSWRFKTLGKHSWISYEMSLELSTSIGWKALLQMRHNPRLLLSTNLHQILRLRNTFTYLSSRRTSPSRHQISSQKPPSNSRLYVSIVSNPRLPRYTCKQEETTIAIIFLRW
jgi:hypothetical protein